MNFVTHATESADLMRRAADMLADTSTDPTTRGQFDRAEGRRGLCKELREAARVIETSPRLELTAQLKWILGRPHYALAPILKDLRRGGLSVGRGAEEQQAVCIHWMLNMYLEHRGDWAPAARGVLSHILDNSRGPR